MKNAPLFTVISDPSVTESDIFASENGHSSLESENSFGQLNHLPRACKKIQAEVPNPSGKYSDIWMSPSMISDDGQADWTLENQRKVYN